jgi:hypothetical protein
MRLCRGSMWNLPGIETANAVICSVNSELLNEFQRYFGSPIGHKNVISE